MFNFDIIRILSVDNETTNSDSITSKKYFHYSLSENYYISENRLNGNGLNVYIFQLKVTKSIKWHTHKIINDDVDDDASWSKLNVQLTMNSKMRNPRTQWHTRHRYSSSSKSEIQTNNQKWKISHETKTSTTFHLFNWFRSMAVLFIHFLFLIRTSVVFRSFSKWQ